MAGPWEKYQTAAQGGDLGPVDTSSTWDSLAPRVVSSLARDLSITPDQAAGIVGQLGYESDGLQAVNERNPAVPGSRGGFGWAQWTGPRRQAFEKWSADHNLSPDSEEANYGFLINELDTTEKGVLDKIRSAPDARSAGQAFTSGYLRPGVVAQDKRDSWTDRALNLIVPKANADTLSQAQGPWMKYRKAAQQEQDAQPGAGTSLKPWEKYKAAQTGSRTRAMDSGMVGSEALDEALANRANTQAGAEDQGNFTRRFSDSLHQAKALGAATLGFAGDVAQRAGIDAGGDLADWGFSKYQDEMKVTNDRAKPNDDITHVWDEVKQGNFGAVSDYLEGGAGYLTGQALEALAAAGAGAAVGSVMPGAGTVGGAVIGVAEKGLLKKIIGKSVESAIARRMEKNVARGMTEEAAKVAARQQLGKEVVGALAGSQAFNMSQEIGTTYGGARDEKKGADLTGGELAQAGTFGTLAALTETAGDVFGIGQFFTKAPTSQAAGGLVEMVKSVGRKARNGALFEGAQELVQTYLERVGSGQSTWDEAAFKDYINSAALGALGGSARGAASGVFEAAKGKGTIDPLDNMYADVAAKRAAEEAAMPGDGSADGVPRLPAPQVTVDSQGNARMDGQPRPEASLDDRQQGAEHHPGADTSTASRPPVPALPAPTITVDSAGGARTTDQRQADLARQQQADDLGLTQDVQAAGRNHPGRPQPITTPVDEAAHAAQTSPVGTPAVEPTDGQKESGNYKLGHTRIGGLDVSIENPEGSVRSGTDSDGETWHTRMAAHYGYVRRTEGADGDQVDVFVKPGTPEDYAGQVFVVDQVDPKTGKFDEHKVMIGYADQQEAEAAYRANYAPDWKGMGNVVPMDMPGFKEWLKGDTTKPAVDTQPTEQPKSKKDFTFAIKPAEGGYIIESDDGGGHVVAGRPKGVGAVFGTPPRVFKSRADAMLYMRKRKMAPAAGQSQAAPEDQVRGAAQTALGVAPVNTGRAPEETQGGQSQPAADLSRQNRDRTRPASIEQMNRIANAPDYDRLGVGRSPNEAAPMVSVAGDAGSIPESDMGSTDRVTLADGTKIPVRYAVVEAGDAMASNAADGTENAAYYEVPKAGQIRALNNGRTAGLQEAYRRGKAGQYRQAMIEDAQAHGVSPDAIRAKREPMLVRVYPDQENQRPNIGALSNPQSNLGMSATEQAANDARIVPVDLLDLGDSGAFDSASNRRFLDAFARAVQQQGEDASQIRDAQGNYSRQFMDRARAAVFHSAYGDETLTALSSESADPDVRNILNALTMAAPDFAGVDAGPLDIRPQLAAAVHQIRGARAQGLNMEQFLAQQDMFGRDPLVDRLTALFWKSIRAPRRIADALRDMALFVQNEQAGAASGDMFGGAQVTALDVIERGENLIRSRYGREQDTQQADLFSVGRSEGGRHAGEAGSTGGQQAGRERAATEDAGSAVSTKAPSEAAPVAPDPRAPTESPEKPTSADVERAKQQFDGNKIFTADAVAKARARLRSKLNQLNSGIDPEVMLDGIIITGAYLESGVREFSAYAKAMIEDMGEAVKPYLLSFYEGARNYPGLDTKGMTAVDQAAREHAAMITPADVQTEAVGKIVKKPGRRTKKTGAAADMTLTQDWGTDHIDGYGQDFNRETGNGVKDAFLKEARQYLGLVSKILADDGYTAHQDDRGRALKPVSSNESGIAGSGDVSLTMAGPDGTGVYITIGDAALRGIVPTTDSGIAIMFRAADNKDRYGGRSTNQWAPTNLSAADLAKLVEYHIQQVAAAKRNQQGAENGGTVQPENVPGRSAPQAAPDAAPDSRPGESMGPRVARDGKGTDQVGGIPAGPESAGRAGAQSAGRPGDEPSGAPRKNGTVRSGSIPASGDDDFVIDEGEIGKGGLGQKYHDNTAAIRTLKAIEAEGRAPTAEERKVLAKYAGWGAMKGPFDPENKAWAKQHQELTELLTPEEFKAARASTLDAHFTSPEVVKTIYAALERLGVRGGRILEPSIGVGNFVGLMPHDLRTASKINGVELDSLTSRMVAAIYPEITVAKSTGFENFDVPAGYFDVVVGNPPFGNTPVTDAQRSPYSGFSVHNYFLAKSIDKLRPGGVMAVVVSHNFMDVPDARVRNLISKQASLVGAVRLPNTAFKENAGTEVVTDILVFQKKDGPTPEYAIEAWEKSAKQQNVNPKTGQSVEHNVNRYFVEHPESVLGTPSAAGTMYGANEYTVEAKGDLEAGLKKWAATLPRDVFAAVDRTQEFLSADKTVPDGVKVESFYVDDKGNVMRRGEDIAGERTSQPWAPRFQSYVGRMKGMIGIRDALRRQMRLERSPDATTTEIEANRRALNQAYDAFQKQYGFLNSVTNRNIFNDDPESHLIQALEVNYDRGISALVAKNEGIEARSPKADKADILSRRVAFPPQDSMEVTTAKDALLASLNFRGRVDPEYMSRVYGKPAAEIIKDLGDLVFDDPQAGVVSSDEYLSGDVKTKLDEARAAAQGDSKYKRNVKALEAVIPKNKGPSDIQVSLGAIFVPPEVYQDFFKHISGGEAVVGYARAVGTWLVHDNGKSDSALNTGRFGTKDMGAQDLFKLIMAGRGAVVRKTFKNSDGSTTTVVLEKETAAARDKQAAIEAEWRKWIWQDPVRGEAILKSYNDTMNRIVTRKYDGAHMTFPGMTPTLSLLPHQKDGVWRGLQSPQVLYDHVVGAGKTFEMAALAMEMRRLGIARKPIFVVPNHLTMQWRTEFTRLYPGSNVLAAAPSDFSKENREKFFSKIVTGDWDAVIIGHSSLKKIGLPPETEKAVLQEQIDQLADAIEQVKRDRGDKRITADMERIRKNLEAKMKDRIASLGKRSKVVTFDELGLDAMFVDEMHEFKNLTYNSTMDRNPGMGNPAGSTKAFDLFVKVRWLFDTFGKRTPFITATGTPVSNSLVEMFNMQRFMQYPTLKAEGLNVFDAWAKQFGRVESVYEVAPSGAGYRQSSRFAKLANLPAIMGMYQSFADTVTLDDLKAQGEARGERFPVPKITGGRPTLVVAKRSPQVAKLMGEPKLRVDEAGDPVFEVDLQDSAPEVRRNEQTGKWTAMVKDSGGLDVMVGIFETEQDAKAAIAQKALTPVIETDQNSIVGRFANLRTLMKASEGKINALSLTSEANKAGLDYRLIDPTAPDFPGSKINLAVANMMQIYDKWKTDKGTQLVFCDLSVPLSARKASGAKARRVYVRNAAGDIEMKRGTLHASQDAEGLPFFVVPVGEKAAKRFAVYDAASGALTIDGFTSKQAAIDGAEKVLATAAGRREWVGKREAMGGDIEQDDIDDYNNEHDVETDNADAFFTGADIAGMSGSSKFSVYDDIKAKLMAHGVPEREIAFIHDYATPTAKDKLFRAVNAGDIRFLLGSTPKMGAGTNVQERLVGLHHIDAPWRPSDLEQREGRIIRRGNKLYERDPEGFGVFIGRYATEQTYDTRRWQILEHKARGIEQLRNYDGTINEVEDINGEAASAADMKAAASGDPLILEETKLRNDVNRLQLLRDAHASEVLSMVRRASDARHYVEEVGPRVVKNLQQLIDVADKNPPNKDGKASVSIDGGKALQEGETANEAITKAFDFVRAHMVDKAIFEYRGLSFRIEYIAGDVALYAPMGDLGGPSWSHMVGWSQTDAFSPSGFVQRMKNYIDRLHGMVADAQARVAELDKDADGLLAQAKQPFSQEQDLADAIAAHKDVQHRLLAKGPAVPASQKAMLAKGLERQRELLRKAGFGDALREIEQAQDYTASTDTPKNTLEEPGAAQQDLFGDFNLEPGVSRDTGARQPATGSVDAGRRDTGGRRLPSLNSKAAAVAIEPDGSRFAVRVEARRTLNLKVQDGKIETAGDVASAMASIRRQPQENLLMLLTDAGGRPISVLRHTMNQKDSTSLVPDILIGHAARVPKAANMWLVHNHPSGNPVLSSADLRMSEMLARVLRDAQIKYQGLMAVGRNSFSNVNAHGDIQNSEAIRPVLRTKDVPVMERVFIKRGTLEGGTISTNNVGHVAQVVSDGKDGVLLLDAQLVPSAFLPMTASEMGKLRGTGGLEKLLAGVEKSNASNAIAIVQSEKSINQARNLNSALTAVSVRALDVVAAGKPISDTGKPIVRPGGVFESRQNPRPRAGVSLSGARVFASAFMKKLPGAGRLKVSVVRSVRDIPEGAKPSDMAEGVYYPADEGGRIYLVADNLPTMERLYQVLAHEVVGHFGVEAMLGNDFDSILSEVRRVARVPAGERATGNEKPGDANYATMEAVGMRYPDYGAKARAREVLARMAETGSHRSLLRMLYAKIRAALRRMGLNLELTDSDLRQMVVDAGRFLRNTPADKAFSGRRMAAASMAASEGVRSGQTDTQAFKTWFGDSKVVDAEGNPLVVYHGTRDNISQFRPGTFFSEDPSEASAYTGVRDMLRHDRLRDRYTAGTIPRDSLDTDLPYTGAGLPEDSDAQAGRIYASDTAIGKYLGKRKWVLFTDAEIDYDAESPEDHVRVVSGDASEDVAQEIADHEEFLQRMGDTRPGGNVVPVYLAIKNPAKLSWRKVNVLGDRLGGTQVMRDKMISDLQAQGYDGIQTTSEEGFAVTGHEVKQWLPFRAEQVKSATGNSGTFGPASANIAESRRDGAPVDLPDAIVGRALGDAGNHPDYKAAKAGDTQAAGRLVSDLVTPEVVAKVRDALGGSKPTIVPVLAVESAGHNKIPLATADRLGAALDLDVDTNIFQSVKAKRTTLSGLDRIFQQPEFDGVVKQGGQYLLVDDTLTQGGTMAALASHIRQNGGQVVGTFALTGKQYSATLRLSPETLKTLRERYGDIENEFRAATGRGFDGLTESEGRYLAKHGTPDSVRARILAEGHARGLGLLQKDLGPQESRLSAQQDETKAPPDAGLFNDGRPTESRANAPAAPATPAKPGAPSAAEQALRDKLLDESGVFFGPETVRDRFNRLQENWKAKAIQGVFDHFLSLKSLNPTAYMQARLSKGTDGAAEYLVRHGAVKLVDGALDGAGTGVGLAKILAGLAGEHDHFMAWIAGNRAERLMAEGRENLFTPAIIERFKNLNKGTMADGRKRREVYAQALKELNILQKSVLDVAQEAGLIDGDTRHLWENEFYVPFYRVMEGDNTGTMGPGQIGGLVGQYAFKKLKGGQEKLGDLTANTVANWSHLLSASMKNLAAQGAIDSAVDIGIAEQIGGAQKGSVRVMVNGHEQHYMVDDPMVLDSLTSLHYVGSNDPIMRAMRKFKHALTIGVTLSPTFRIRNLLRDSLQAVAIDSDIKLNPVANMIQGWKSTGAESDTMRTLLVGGGAVRFGSFNDGQARNVKRLVGELQIDPGQILASPRQLAAFAKKTFDWYQELGDRGETVNRAAIYEAARKNGKSHLEASFLARDLMDFTNTGAWAAVRLLTQVVPFMNARLQGMYKLGRGAVSDPARFIAVTGTMALASAALFLAMKDDKDYKELPDWARNNYWVAKIGNKMVFVPKPFEVGALGSVVERATELAFAGDDYRMKDFGKTMLQIMGDQLAMNPVPQMFMPAAEAAFNYDTFRGRTIDTEAQQHLPPGERFHASTSAGAIALGRAINVSPQRIEHLASGYLGWLGMQALNVADYLARPLSNLPENPRRDLGRIDNWFVVGDLVKDQDARTTKYIQRFYDMQNDVNQVYAAYNQARAMGDVERARDLANSDTAKLYGIAKAAGRDMTRVTQAIRKLERSQEPMDKKRAELDRLYEIRNRTAAIADERARAVK